MNVEAIPMGPHRLTVRMDVCGTGGTGHKCGRGGIWYSCRSTSRMSGKFLSGSLKQGKEA